MRRVAVTFNGISIAYVLGFVNAVMAVINAFGLNLNETQRVAVVGLVNAALILAVHMAHRVGEASLNDASHQLSKDKMTDAANANRDA
jgi:hypothetical protein